MSESVTIAFILTCRSNFLYHYLLITQCSLLGIFLFSTCFNRLDLPVYGSKEELLEKLKISIATSATGFDIE